MSVSTVITLGYGSFGSPSFVVRLGFGSGVYQENLIYGESVEFRASRLRAMEATRERAFDGERLRLLFSERSSGFDADRTRQIDHERLP